VLLHGWGAFKEIWWGTIKALAPSCAAIALDWPGHGSPALEAGQEILEALAEVTEAICEALGLRNVALAGHSMGGNIAARVALRRPDLVSRLILVDAAIDPRYLSKLSRMYIHPHWGARVIRLNRVLTRPVIRWGARVPHENGGGVLRTWARRASYMARVEPMVLHTYLEALYQGSLAERVREITQPTLVVTGARDALVSPEQARSLARTIRHAELAIIPRAYHNPMDEQPAAFHRAMIEFLQRHPGQKPSPPSDED
jgi:pimeloyl-ACP methyl ester carboxylesterase